MKKLILLCLMALAYGVTTAQTPTYTPMKSFYEFKGIKMDSLFLLPAFADTTSANTGRIKSIIGSVINVGGILYERRNNKWNQLSKNILNSNLTAQEGTLSHEMGYADLSFNNGNKFQFFALSDDGQSKSLNLQNTDKITLWAANMDNLSTPANDSIGLVLDGSAGTGKFFYKSYNLRIPETIKTQNDTIATRAFARSAGGSTDTTSLNNRINLKLDSLKRSNDSVYAWRNGAKVFQFKDSLKPDRPNRIDGSASSNVGANMNTYDFALYEANKIDLRTTNDNAMIRLEGQVVSIGDVKPSNNQTQIIIDDANGIITGNYFGNINGFSFDYLNSNGEYIIGDLVDNFPTLGVIKGDSSITFNTKKIAMSTGTDAPLGSGTFTSGSVTITSTAVTASSKIFITYTNCPGGNCGTPYIDAITPGVSFDVKSNNASDNSDFNYLIIN